MNRRLLHLKLTLLNTAKVALDKQWNYSDVISPFSRLYYIKSGGAKVYHSNHTFELSPGNMYLIPSFTHGRYICEGNMEQYYISFLEDFGEGLSIYHHKAFIYEHKASENDIRNFERLIQINPNRALVYNDPKIYDNYDSLLSFQKRNELMTTQRFLETHGLLLSLFSSFILDDKPNVVNESQTSLRITDTIQYITQNLKSDLTVKALADRVFMNPDYFSRIFKEKTGIRPNRFIQKKRIERAQTLLLSTVENIPTIAGEVGLPNVSYFSRLFKKLSGYKPSEFRKKNWEV